MQLFFQKTINGPIGHEILKYDNARIKINKICG